MSRKKAMSTFPQLSPQPLAVRSWPTKACTIPPPRSMALVPAALVWLVHTWMMLPPDPMGPAALTALKQTAGDRSTYELTRWNRRRKVLYHWTCNICCECVVWWRFGQKKVHREKVIFVLLYWQDKWPLKERPLLASYLEDCEFSNCLYNATARVHCCCSSTVGVLSLIVAMKHLILTHSVGACWLLSAHFTLIAASCNNPQWWSFNPVLTTHVFQIFKNILSMATQHLYIPTKHLNNGIPTDFVVHCLQQICDSILLSHSASAQGKDLR